MRASLNWLKEFVDIDLTPVELADVLTMAGLEVESVIKIEEDLSHVVVGKVLSIKSHPNADKLSLCQVSIGDGTFPVVCGARNMKVGDKVPLALEGALLPNSMKIRKAGIRGELSEGMMCSEEELGIGEDSSGIMILEDDLVLGMDIVSALNLEDHIFDLNITPNRPDCLSIAGLAREVAAVTGKVLKIPSIEVREEDGRIHDLTSVDVRDPELCPRYSARLISDVAVGTSPFWIRRRLESVGVRPICNVVDVTNYVLMAFGQPLHAFDFDLLSEKRIVVKRAKDGDTFATLDRLERTLQGDALMICDGEKPVAIGGIMGGLNSEVSETTSNVLIESAYFDPSNIRKTSKKLGLQTEASYRFERGVDPEGVINALNITTQMIADLCDGKVAQGIIDQCPSPFLPKEITLSIRRINKILGTSLEKERVRRYLKAIELDNKNLDRDKLIVRVPPLRVDLNREIDLIEEVARLNGYDNIPTTTPLARVTSGRRSSAWVAEDKVKYVLISLGYYEVVNYSFISPKLITSLGVDANHPFHKFIRIKNPLSEEQSIMRTTLIPGLLRTMKTNVYNKNSDLKLFEIGTVFFPNKEDKLPIEKRMLSALVTGLRYVEAWNFSGDEIDYYDIKGSLENLFRALNIRGCNFSCAGDIPYLHPGKSSTIMIGDTQIGFLGEVHSEVLENHDLSKTAHIFEIDFDLLVKHAFSKKKINLLSKYPPIYRDMALIVKEDVQSRDIYDAIIGCNNSLVKEIQVFDVYEGEPIASGEKSLAYRIKYQSFKRTLTDQEVNKAHKKLVSKVLEDMGARIRL